MRIAFVTLMYDAPWGGSEVLWSQTAARALAEGHEVLASVYEWPEQSAPLLALDKAGAKFFFRSRYRHNLRYRAANWLARVPFAGDLPEIRALARFKPDVVMISQAGCMDLLFHEQLKNWLRNVPFALACHNYNDPVRQHSFPRIQLTELYRQAHEVLMISENQLRILQRQLIDPIANARVVQNPLNMPAEYPVPYSPAADGNWRLSVVGSFDVDRKGQDVLLEALTAPEWADRNYQVNFYGKGPDQAYLEELIQFYGLGNRVKLRGHVADARAIWRETDMLVIPSRIESGPMVLQEAMLCGRPVVAADVGMVREWLDDEEMGFIADSSTPVALNKALNRAWERRAEWRAMGELASSHTLPRLENDPAGHLLERLVSFATNVTTESLSK